MRAVARQPSTGARTMKAFDYTRPRSLDEALGLLADLGDGAAPLAGGTDLLVQMDKGCARRAPSST